MHTQGMLVLETASERSKNTPGVGTWHRAFLLAGLTTLKLLLERVWGLLAEEPQAYWMLTRWAGSHETGHSATSNLVLVCFVPWGRRLLFQFPPRLHV